MRKNTEEEPKSIVEGVGKIYEEGIAEGVSSILLESEANQALDSEYVKVPL